MYLSAIHFKSLESKILPLFQDCHLLQSSSSTERVKLWNKFNTKVDHEVVKLEFFRKVHNKNPPFRVKSKLKPKSAVEIPEIVEYHYKNPPKLLPSHRDILRLDTLKQRGTVNMDFVKKNCHLEVDNDLEGIRCARKKLKNMIGEVENIEKLFESEEDETEDQDVVMAEDIKEETKETKELHEESAKTGDKLSEPEDKSNAKPPPTKGSKKEYPLRMPENTNVMETMSIDSEKTKSVDEVIHNRTKMSEIDPRVTVKVEDGESEDDTPAIDAELQNLDEKTIRLLACQRLQHILNEYPDLIKNYQDKKSASKTVKDLAKKEFQKKPIALPSQLLTKEDIAKITRTLSTNEAVEVKQENNKKSSLAQKGYDLRQKPFNQRSDEEKAQTIALSLEKPIQQSKIRGRAVFTPVNDYLTGDVWFTAAPNMEKSVQMRYRSFQVGSGPGNDLNLTLFGKCAFLSPKHAVIFYDEVSFANIQQTIPFILIAFLSSTLSAGYKTI